MGTKKTKDPRSQVKIDREAEMRKLGLISVTEAARLSHVPSATIYTWIREGALTKHPFGMRSYFIKIAELRKLIPMLSDEAIS